MAPIISTKTPPKSAAGSKHVIGWSEYVDFPDWGIRGVKAKVDTGARTSALHVDGLTELPGKRVRFYVVLCRHNVERRVRAEARVVKRARVRSSTGHYMTRYFISTRVRLGPVVKEIELSLVSRDDMLFRMLLGRKALEHDFLVDVNRRNLLGDRPRKKKAAGKKPGKSAGRKAPR